MTYDELSDWLRVIAAIIGFFTFVALIATTWVTIKANKEKEVKNKEQQERIEKLKNDTAKLEKEITEAKTKQIEAEKALLELQNRISPRSLTQEQQTKLLAALKTLPKDSIDIHFISGNEESIQYAEQFIRVFKDAGWQVQPKAAITSFSVLGLHIIGSGSDSPVMSLTQAFKDCGIQINGNESFPPDLPNSVSLTVGAKP
ncbi:MAG: hypothetical protein LC768_09770 [Acidobacteria bacterium]|nr:hypothetical protein [Acidobacteriota bacterium]